MIRSILVMLLLLLLSSTAAAATLEVFDASRLNADGSPLGWTLKVKSGTAKVVKESDGSVPGLCLDSMDSSFSIQRDVKIDIAKYPLLTWRWRADVLPPRGDMRSSGTDDQAAQVFVAFEDRSAIQYIWDTNAPVGTVGSFSIPFIIHIKILVVANKQNKLGEWTTMTRNLREDYRRLFGRDPGNISGVRFQANSQHTNSRAQGCISRIAFHD